MDAIKIMADDTILKEMETHLPDHSKGLKELEGAFGTDLFDEKLESVYKGFEGISFDYGIMEKTKEDVYVVPCQCGWSDIGSWLSLYEFTSSDHDQDKNRKVGEAVLVDCERSFIYSKGERVVVCLGLKGCLVVDTGDALLVADMKSAQDIGRVVESLRVEGREDIL